ncbi:protoheme IX farnesyltransferase [Sphingomonadales bacterium EhC05]|jgi:protoheme IX farnesyltransferase|uniref:heme o synthase n=1 Tax=Parasphingorhabdus sp. TaxID=2709688 RepID=UPI0007F44EB0|nr:protoheme IX farnesyltransferase [Sphingomonadales bacterium EhC05]
MTTASTSLYGLASARDLFALTKPRVMTLVIFTALCGMLAAPGSIHPVIGFTAILAISLGAGASAALNQWYEADIDAIMKRTSQRPLPAGRMDAETALHFGIGLSVFSVVLMGVAVNWFSAVFLAFSIFFYAVVYTIWLKRSTPQNIVIGGAAGAFPPAIGWAAVTGDVTLMPVLLFAIIFFWTPPHFWALALFMNSDYSKAGIPMMPVVAGRESTRKQIFGYSLILAAIAIAPYPLGFTGAIYGTSAILLSVVFSALSLQVMMSQTSEPKDMAAEKRLFKFSILYLFALFAALVADRLVLA